MRERRTARPRPRPGVRGAAPVLVALLASAVLAACDLPRDPHGTLERVRSGTLRVGVAETPPWIVRGDGDAPGGVEAELVRAFARHVGARVEWHWGGVESHLEALERWELDLVAAGLTDASPWRERVAFSAPYLVTEVRVGFPPQAPLPPALDGVRVAVRPASADAARVRDAGAVPVAHAAPRGSDLPVAAEDWQLRGWGYTATATVLAERRRVLAAPPGENGWLVALGRFVTPRRAAVRDALEREGPR